MARLTRTESFSDDDLEAINSQAANLSLYNGDGTPSSSHSNSTANTRSPPEVIDLSSSPAPAPAYRSLNSLDTRHPDNSPVFGKPGKLMSSLKQKAANASLFYQPKNRPELHRQKQEAHVRSPGKKQPELFSSLAPEAQPKPQYIQSAYCRSPQKSSNAVYMDPTFYTDPGQAEADLKALLEGGMEDDEKGEDEDTNGTLDDGTVEGVKVKLLPHQVEGLKWMKGRELGPVKRGKVPKGGILADDMGLGKTLQSISLILSNPRPERDSPEWKKSLNGTDRGTLVVAPLALIRQWEAELAEKVSKSHRLSVLVHHGPSRTKRWQDLTKYDVVITTYQIVASEFKYSSETVKVGCFGFRWYRIILDEAHTIKNRSAKMTKACYALDSEFRWCLTGTPMQNNLDELQSLVHFLRIQPYDSFERWRDEIEKPLRSGQGHVAIDRLHVLLPSFMKRRTKDILKEEGALLPGGKKALEAAANQEEVEAPTSKFKITERKVVAIKAEFSPAERRFYDTLAESADRSLEKMMQSKLNYANALVLLLRLRQACNHPALAGKRLEDDTDALTTEGPISKASKTSHVDDLTDAFGGMGLETKKCGVCLQDLLGERAQKGETHCKNCADGFAKLYSESPKMKKSKKATSREFKAKKLVKSEQNRRTARKRNIVMDSDDEEGDGSWLVDEDQRGALHLGKAGGTDDENAEGEGENIGSDDSLHSEEEDGSRLGSFIVDDEDASQQPEMDSDDETFVSLDKMTVPRPVKSEKKPCKSDRRVVDSNDESAADSEEELSQDGSEDESDFSGDHRIQASQRQMGSAKIREVIRILKKEAKHHKFIVFSQFTSMLDLVEPFLRRQGFEYVRYDGQMRNDAREESLYRLRNDKRVRVLLCSLKCGSLGLNLTAATRVIIIEPFWNPVGFFLIITCTHCMLTMPL